MKKIEVAFTHPYFAHYRKWLLTELLHNDKNISYSFFSGKSVSAVNLNIIDSTTIPMTYIKNIWIKNSLFQTGLLFKVILSPKYHVVVFMGVPYHISTWIYTVLARLFGKKTVFYTHGINRNKRENKLLYVLRLCFLKLPNINWVYSNYAKRRLGKEKFDPKNIDVMYNSLDYEYHKKLKNKFIHLDKNKERRELFKNPHLIQLIFTGRLIKNKKLHLLIEAMGILKSRHIHCNCILIGDGPEKTHLKSLVETYDLQDNVLFYGVCHDDLSVGKLLYVSDLCVIPGLVGLSAIHALSFECPIITHDSSVKNPTYIQHCPEIDSVVENKNGLFFKENCAQDLSCKIEHLIDAPVIRENLRENCLYTIDKFYNPKNQAAIINKSIIGAVS